MPAQLSRRQASVGELNYMALVGVDAFLCDCNLPTGVSGRTGTVQVCGTARAPEQLCARVALHTCTVS